MKKKPLVPHPVEVDTKEKNLRMVVQHDEAKFDAQYRYDDSFRAGNPNDFRSVHSIPEMIECLKLNKDIECEGIFMAANRDKQYRYQRINGREKILEAWKSNAKRKFREADNFATDGYGGTAGANAGLVGDDYVPLLGGPFNKQPYLYDYQRALSYAFFEYHHHPFGRAIIHITRDFVLGRGYRVDSEDQLALAMWRAFEKVNRLQERMEDIVKEGSLYGENLIWWLPNNSVYVEWQDGPNQKPARGLIPRIRLIDPSTCWEIVTFPEDMERVLTYNLVFPTQYQIFTGKYKGEGVPTSKFIWQQIPAEDVMHFKYNCASNEKRGRSDLYPAFGYLKWVRDCVNYKLIALKKQAAWTEDISIAGSQADVDNLAQSLANLGEFEPAGSRFIHTDKIKREYMANHGSSSAGDDTTLMHGIDMICASVGIPVSYFGLSKSAGQTRASAVVGTEPVAKKFERRQQEVTRILQAMWAKFQDGWGVKGAECTVIFPEIITQDSSQKLKDIKFTEDCGYIARATAAPLAAKEIGIDDYDFDTERLLIEQEAAEMRPMDGLIVAPLTAPAAKAAGTATPGAAPAQHPLTPGSTPDQNKPSAVTGKDRKAVKSQDSGRSVQ